MRIAASTAVLALAACDARPTAPGPQAQPRADVDAPMSLGGGFVPSPGTTATADVTSPARVTLASIPDNTWVVINVSGQIKLTWNDACNSLPPFWPCPGSSPTGDFESVPSSSGPVRLWSVQGSRGSWATLRGSGGKGETPGSAVGLLRQEAAGTLEGEMALAPVYAWNPNTGGGTPSWYVGGGYSVTVAAVPNPLEITEGEPDSSGTRTYTVEALYGLEFMNPSGDFRPPGAIVWYFFPGDSVSSKPGWEGDYYFLGGPCFHSATCRFRPPGPGRMQVEAYVERQTVIARAGGGAPECQVTPGLLGSRSARYSITGNTCQQEPKLVLRCDGRTDSDTVMRGNPMECITSPEPSGATVADLKWEFHDEQGHTITGPAGEMKWRGIMVVGGQMQVSGTVNGKAQAPPPLAVTVRPRDWTGKISFPEEPDPQYVRGDPLRYPPLVKGDTLADGTLGLSTWAEPEPASGWGEGTGPNEGWFFLDQPPYFSRRESHIWLNVALLPDDPFYKAQQGPPHAGHIQMERPMCSQDFMAHAARHVPAHEHGHYARAEAFAESTTGAALLEAAVHYGDPVEPEQVREAFAAYLQASEAIQKKWDAENVLQVPCDFAPIRN